MKILALETSTEYLSVALQNGEHVFARDCLAGQRHSELLLPFVAVVLREAGVERHSLDAIAFGAGPGSFTGLRIACGVAQGLAFGLALPVVPVSTLEAVAEAVDRNRVVVALDARMGEIYFGAFERREQRWHAVVAAQLCKPAAAPLLEGTDWYAAGSGFAAHATLLAARYPGQLAGTASEIMPHARQVARLAGFACQRGESLPAAEALPLYIRNKIALTSAEQAARR